MWKIHGFSVRCVRVDKYVLTVMAKTEVATDSEPSLEIITKSTQYRANYGIKQRFSRILAIFGVFWFVSLLIKFQVSCSFIWNLQKNLLYFLVILCA